MTNDKSSSSKMLLARGRVAEGVKVLDEKVPGWWRVIQLDRLNMADCHTCMLGQLFGYDAEVAIGTAMFGLSATKPEGPISRQAESGYWRGSMALSVNGTEIGCNEFYQADHSCNTDDDEDEDNQIYIGFNTLKCAWAEVIAERRAIEEVANHGTN